jgi:hypothetical protein
MREPKRKANYVHSLQSTKHSQFISKNVLIFHMKNPLIEFPHDKY